MQPNTPQLAMIGDNKTQGEIVAPEDKLQELLNKAANNSANQEELELLRQMVALLKQVIEAITGISLDTEISGRDLLVMLKNAQSRGGTALVE